MMTFFHTLMERPRRNIGGAERARSRSTRETEPNRSRRTARKADATPSNRRRDARLHRILASVCAGLAVFAALHSVRLSFATQPVVVATQAIAKGDTIARGMVELRDIPFDESLRGAIHTIDDAVGAIAQVDIGKNNAVMASMARASPTVPQGHTSVEVRLASAADGLLPGDRVTLSGAVATGSGAPDGSGMPDAVDADGNPPATRLSTLSSDALLTTKPSKDAQGNAVAVFAMPPEEAAIVLHAQEYRAVIATVNRRP